MACRLSAKVCFRFSRYFLHGNGPKVLQVLQPCSISIARRNTSHDLISAPVQDNWQLWSGVCVERAAITTQTPSELEEDYHTLQQHIEHENSYLSLHELHHKADIVEAEKLSQQEEFSEADATRQTALDLEDTWEAYFNRFTQPSRTTDDDKKNNCKSLKRKLDRKLILIVKQKLGDQSVWVFPQGERTEGESMKQTAQRVLGSSIGDSVKARFIGNAPCGHHKYKLPSEIRTQTNTTGVKLFFFKAYHDGGEIKLGENFEDYLWLTKEELKSYLAPSYYKQTKDFILEL